MLDSIERENDSYKAKKVKYIPGSDMAMLNQRNGNIKLMKKSGSVGFDSREGPTEKEASKLFAKTQEESMIDF